MNQGSKVFIGIEATSAAVAAATRLASCYLPVNRKPLQPAQGSCLQVDR